MKKPSFRLNHFPLPIAIFFLVFLLIPAVLVGIVAELTPVHLVLYLVLPWTICAALLARPRYFLPLYLLLCLGIAFDTAWTVADPWEELILRGLLVALNVYAGALFGSARLRYPLVARDDRRWRMRPRLDVRVPVYLTDRAWTEEVPATLVDCSETGMRLEVPLAAARGIAAQRAIDSRMVVAVRWRGEQFAIPVQVVWSTDSSTTRSFGVRVTDPERMAEFFARLREGQSERVPARARA